MSPKKTNHRAPNPRRFQRIVCKSLPAFVPSFRPGEIASRERSLDFYLSAGMPLPNPDPVLKRMGKDISVYTDLLADDHVGGCADSRAAGVLSLDWAVDNGKAQSRSAAFVKDMLDALDMPRLVAEILKAPLFGYSVLEIVWNIGADNLVRPVSVQKKPCAWFSFDGYDKLMFRSKENPLGEILPPRKFLLASHKASYENPYGEPVLSRIFWPATFKKGGLKFWTIFIEKYGMPHVIGKNPRGTGDADTNDLLYKLENMVQDAVAVIPDDSSVEIKDFAASGGSIDAYERYLVYCEKSISKGLLGQTLTTDVGDKGSYAAAKTHMEVRGDIVTSDKKVVEQTIQQLINWTCELNFPGEPVPVYSMFAPEDVDMDQATRDKVLTDCGVKFTPVYFQREYNLKPEDFTLIDPPGYSGAAQPSNATPFAGKAPAPAAQQAEVEDPITAAADKLDPAALQAQIEGVLAPVLEAIKAGDYQAMESGLIAAYPEMDTKKFQETLARAIYVSEIWGRLTANKA
ncbi:MAG: DUF935 family protein [Elusimicrobia bacterium]|nr:DUF935 family protein [Elusimicrobiota bacterium]